MFAMIVVIGTGILMLLNIAYYFKRLREIDKLELLEKTEQAKHLYYCPNGCEFETPIRIHDYTKDPPLTYLICPICGATLKKAVFGTLKEKQVEPKRKKLPKLLLKKKKKKQQKGVITINGKQIKWIE